MTEPATDTATETPPSAPAARESTLPTFTVEVLSTSGHSAVGLFVVFRPKPRAIEDRLPGFTPLLDVVEEIDLDANDDVNDFFLAIVGTEGFLELVHEVNPWPDRYAANSVHTVKLAPPERCRYEGLLVRHPDPNLAIELVQYLRGDDEYADVFEASFGAREDLIDRVRSEELPIAWEEGQLRMRVPESASAYLPLGSGRYGSWVLYRDMPLGTLRALNDEVAKLQTDLGLLRYPGGSADAPFSPLARKPLSTAEGADPSVERPNFGGETQAAVGRFQENLARGEAFLLSHKAEAHAGHDWAYVLAERANADRVEGTCPGVVDEATGDAIADWIERGLRKPDDVLLPLSSDIQAFPSVRLWMLQAGAVAMEAWNELSLVFGTYPLKSGHTFRSIADQESKPGKRMNSIHKTGLALDFTGGAKADTRDIFPLRFEALWLTPTNSKRRSAERDTEKAERTIEKEEPRRERAAADLRAAEAELAAAERELEQAQMYAQLDGRDTRSEQRARDRAATKVEKERTRLAEIDAKIAGADATILDRGDASSDDLWGVRWRLYAHSSYDFFGPDHGTAFHQLKRMLGDYPDRLRQRLAALFGPLSEHPDTLDWIDRAIVKHEKEARRIRSMSDSEIESRFLRATVHQWLFTPYHVVGGYETPEPWGPSDPQPGAGRNPAERELIAMFEPCTAFEAKSFVNITALGASCGMARIGGNRRHATRSQWGSDATVPLTLTSTSLGSLRTMLLYLQNEIAQNPESPYASKTIPVVTPGPRKSVVSRVEIPLRALDIDFVKAWIDAIPAMTVRSVVSFSAMDATITFAKAPAQVAAIESGILAKLGGDFARKYFWIESAGPLTKVEARSVFTGEALAAELGAALDAFAAATAGSSTSKKRADYQIVLRPIFRPSDAETVSRELDTFGPGDIVMLPAAPAANVEDLWRPLEWWHYQHESAQGAKWGDLLELCGLSSNIMSGKDPTHPLKRNETPPAPSEFRIYPRGLGYPEDNFPDKSGGVAPGDVENEWTPSPFDDQGRTHAE